MPNTAVPLDLERSLDRLAVPPARPRVALNRGQWFGHHRLLNLSGAAEHAGRQELAPDADGDRQQYEPNDDVVGLARRHDASDPLAPSVPAGRWRKASSR